MSLPIKYANASVEDPVLKIQDWSKLYGQKAFGHKLAASTKAVANEVTNYLLSHATIMCSVMTEPDPHDYLIKLPCSHLANNNDDAWENDVMQRSYRSFIGAFNFLEHYQNTKKSKGHILDAVLRKVDIAPEVWVWFVDILVATDLADEKLTSEIRTGKMKYMSMGCVTDLVICSICGARIVDDQAYCQHLLYRKGTFALDDEENPRRVAELCGHKSLPNGGVRFVEASWVETPAFPGAAVRDIVADSWTGPKTRYTKAANLDGLQKAASSLIGEDKVAAQIGVSRIFR